jgi:hypothetical protein
MFRAGALDVGRFVDSVGHGKLVGNQEEHLLSLRRHITKISVVSTDIHDRLAKLDQCISDINRSMNVVVKPLFAATKGAFFEVILPAFGPPSWDLQKVIRATKVVVVKFRGTSEFEILHMACV